MFRLFSLMTLVIAGCGLSFAQSTPFLSHQDTRMLTDELSGDRAYEHIRGLSHWHRDSGTAGYFKAVDYVMTAAREAGLEDVKFIEQPMRGRSYTANRAELWMVEPFPMKLADLGDHATVLADGSHSADLTAELVSIDGENIDELDLKGKIVLTRQEPMAGLQAVWEKGAAGIVSYTTSEGRHPMDFPDQIAWSRVPLTPPEGKPGTFAFMLSPRMGDGLAQMLASTEVRDYFATGHRVAGGRIVVKALVDTTISEGTGKTGFVEAYIRGSKYHDQQIVVTAHLQEEQGSANDDGSGCANLLEMGRVFARLIKEGKMERPLRDIRFWWSDEIYSEYKYFADHPEETKRFMVNLHQDMTGAKMSLGSRTQHLIYAPFSRTSYLDTLFHDIGTWLIHTNNPYLSAGRAGDLNRPHSQPIYAMRGTREGYRAEFVPYFGQSDYMCFVEGIIGVPAIGLINWDDHLIHSSDDDLFGIDQTQLERNAFLVSSMALVLGRATSDIMPMLGGQTYALGQRRLADARATAWRIITEDPSAIGRRDAEMVVEQAVEREIAAIASLAVFADDKSDGANLINDLVKNLRSDAPKMRKRLQTFYAEVHGKDAPQIKLTKAEKSAMKKVPANIKDLAAYFENRPRFIPELKMHGLMKQEVFNFVDGKRSYYDIYRAVRAEALIVGAWYYKQVSLEDVVKVLDTAVEAKALELVKS